VIARYGNIGARYADFEVGHCAQNIQLQAQALGLGSVVVGAFQDNLVMSSLGIKETPVYIIPVGRKKE
jgi:nitroreductase